MRRPLLSRGSRWAGALAAALARAGLSPNAISLLGLLLALAGAAALALRGLLDPSPGLAVALLLTGAAGSQLRLLCNLMDGMVAVEHGAGATRLGEIYNELPDRLSDAVLAIGAGLAASALPGSLHLGQTFALLCVLAAYIRTLGGSVGAGQAFLGPFSKPVRGAVLSAACVVAALAVPAGHDAEILRGALVLLVAGTALTCLRRTLWIARRLS